VASGPSVGPLGGTSDQSKDLWPAQPQQDCALDQTQNQWLRVYDPAHRLQGYVDWPHIAVIDDPPIAESDPTCGGFPAGRRIGANGGDRQPLDSAWRPGDFWRPLDCSRHWEDDRLRSSWSGERAFFLAAQLLGIHEDLALVRDLGRWRSERSNPGIRRHGWPIFLSARNDHRVRVSRLFQYGLGLALRLPVIPTIVLRSRCLQW